MFHILYLVHDLSDPAVRRRMMMLVAGGAKVTLAGFRRSKLPIEKVAGIVPIDLGVTSDGRFLQRIAAISAAALRLRGHLKTVPKPDAIMGRNLEMLALAKRACGFLGADVPVIYECLDIHRLLLRNDAIGNGMRSVERALARKADLLITSSPAFLREYFVPRQQMSAPALLLENKVLSLSADEPASAPEAPLYCKPVRIGWFGALRCQRSLALLSAFTRRQEGRYEAVLRGRPALSEFTDFSAEVAAEPHLSFEGPYRNPEDLAGIYGSVHFTWAIDFFEAGLNSDWLLPNRLYEGCRYGVVPIAMAGTETARFLSDHGLGLILPEPTPEALEQLLSPIDEAVYARERGRVVLQPRERWVADETECRALVTRLRELRQGTESHDWGAAA